MEWLGGPLGGLTADLRPAKITEAGNLEFGHA